MPATNRPVQLTEAQDFLSTRFGDRASGVAELGAGDWSRAFSFELDGHAMVARFGQHCADFERDREAMSYAGPDLPVPAVTEIGEAMGGAFAISERSYGIFLESLDRVGWRRVLPALFRALDALREHPTRWPQGLIDHPGATDMPGGLWGAQLLIGLADDPDGRVSGWRATLAKSPEIDTLFESAKQQVTELLEICPQEPHLIHADMLNRNVLVAADATRLAAVFDWGCLKYGDFLYELAWFTFWGPWHPQLEAIDIRSAAIAHYRSIGLPTPQFDQRLRCYELHIGLDHLAYAAFTGNADTLQAVADRTREILDGP